MFRVDYVYYKANKCADILAKLDALQAPTFVLNYVRDTILCHNSSYGDTLLPIMASCAKSCVPNIIRLFWM